MNCCKREQVGTKEHGKMLKRIQALEDARIPAKEARNWKIEGPNRRITRKEYRRLWNKFETGGFIAKKGLWNVARERMLRNSRALPKDEEGDIVTEYKGMHEDNFQSSWLREDVESILERRKDIEKKKNQRGGKHKWKKRSGERRGGNGSEKKVCQPFFQ